MNNDYQIITKNWRGIEIEIRWQNSYVEFEDGRHLGHLVACEQSDFGAFRIICL